MVWLPHVCTAIHICTGCSAGGSLPVPQAAQGCLRDGDKGSSCCASHSSTPLGGTRHHPQAHASPFPMSLVEVWGWVGSGRVREGPLGFLHLRQAGKGQIWPIAQSGVQPSPEAPAPSHWGGMGAWLCSAALSPSQFSQGGDGGVLPLQPRPRLTHTRAGKETPIVAALMAYTWLEDAVEKRPGAGGEGWGVERV